MLTLIFIVLVIIAYYLWRIHQQRELDKQEAWDKEYEIQQEEQRKIKFKAYPHLYGKLEGNWLDVFSSYAENGTPLLKLSWMLMLEASVKIDYSEGSMKWDSLWDSTEELLEHLQKYHEGSVVEHEIAVTTYWQIASEAVSELIAENPEIDGSKIETKPYTNINEIVSLFPKKDKHPSNEINFFDSDGTFPRKSKGSKIIQTKLREQGA